MSSLCRSPTFSLLAVTVQKLGGGAFLSRLSLILHTARVEAGQKAGGEAKSLLAYITS